jgi:hypothetical protein
MRSPPESFQTAKKKEVVKSEAYRKEGWGSGLFSQMKMCFRREEAGCCRSRDPGLSAPAFWGIQLHGCLKYKSLRGHTKILKYLYHSGDESQPIF